MYSEHFLRKGVNIFADDILKGEHHLIKGEPGGPPIQSPQEVFRRHSKLYLTNANGWLAY